MGNVILPVHGIRCDVHGAWRVREHPGDGQRTDRLVQTGGMPRVWNRVFPVGADHSTGLQRDSFSAVCGRYDLAGLLGFPRVDQYHADRFDPAGSILLLQSRLGLG